MDTPELCPRCLSKYEEIHGMIYVFGSVIGTRCDHDWHYGAGYEPSKIVLTDSDREFLRDLKVVL